jgi:hypothetical protein
MGVAGSVPVVGGQIVLTVNASSYANGSGEHTIEVPKGMVADPVWLPIPWGGGSSRSHMEAQQYRISCSPSCLTDVVPLLKHGSQLGGHLGGIDSALPFGHVRLRSPLHPGTHSITVRYEPLLLGTDDEQQNAPRNVKPLSPYAPFPAPSWSAHVIGEDRETKGDWKGKYGADGFVILAASNASQLRDLPGYITSVAVQPQKNWDSVHTLCGLHGLAVVCDDRGLQMPTGIAGLRTLGNTFADHRGTGTMEIVFAERRRVRISLYMCDYNLASGSVLGQPLAQALIVTDIRSATNSTAFQQIMPATLVGNAEGGVWLSMSVEDSVRIRFAGVSGDNPTLSGIFFDEI